MNSVNFCKHFEVMNIWENVENLRFFFHSFLKFTLEGDTLFAQI